MHVMNVSCCLAPTVRASLPLSFCVSGNCQLTTLLSSAFIHPQPHISSIQSSTTSCDDIIYGLPCHMIAVAMPTSWGHNNECANVCFGINGLQEVCVYLYYWHVQILYPRTKVQVHFRVTRMQVLQWINTTLPFRFLGIRNGGSFYTQTLLLLQGRGGDNIYTLIASSILTARQSINRI